MNAAAIALLEVEMCSVQIILVPRCCHSMYIHACKMIRNARLESSHTYIQDWFKAVLVPHIEFSSEVQTDTIQSFDSLGYPG